MARETVENKNRDQRSGDGPEAETDPEAEAKTDPDAGSEAKPAAEGGGKRGGKPSVKARGGDSGTTAAAAQARAVMQRRHRRIGFAMTAAVGVEVAGAAALVVAGLLPWEWGERLWGRTDTGALVLQVAIAVTVLTLVVGWLPARAGQSARADRLRPRSRTVALLPALVVVVGGVAMVWQAPDGGREAGPVVAAVAAVLVIAGAVGWLVELRRLRVLFPFGLQDARVGGFGNLAAVRRAMLVGGPAGAIGGIVVVAGTLLVVPGLVTTEDSQTAGGLALDGPPPAAGAEPAWELSVAGGASATVQATAGGLVVEEQQGVRVVDPRDGTARWHWRDEAYQRIASVVTDHGDTLVLAMQYDGDEAGRDRVVALDTATGEVRWDRFDDSLVADMGLVAVAPADGDWFVVPEQGAPVSPEQPGAPLGLRAIGSDGETRWRSGQTAGCSLTSVNADAGATVVIGQECTGDGGEGDAAAGGCQVSGLDPATGTESWSWPASGGTGSGDGGNGSGDEPVSSCQTTPRPGMVFVTYQLGSDSAAVALDPATGSEVWSVADGDVTGLSNPVLVGDAVLGTQPSEDGSGAVLVVREAADGAVREEVPLPAGQPIEIMAAREGFAAVSHYRPESAEVVLLELDIAAATVTAETVVATSPPDAAFQRVSLAVGPSTLAVDALLAAGPEPGPDDYTLLIHGFG
ncbi:MAG: PQQ-binding-like beta-propeller repeat protein [Micromonosporaceae bacterium]|nr:PQQ-binding-like beta-propeller repeat protein [Micromonosporaceae bacterium]